MRIGRLHATYGAGADPAALDPVLHRVATTGLADALQREPLPAAWAVCVRELRVPVHLDDPRAPLGSLARTWASLILAALRTQVEASDGAVDGDAVVVYRSEVEALADLVRGVAAGDTRRAWAWRQVGLVSSRTTPGRAEVAVALGERPALVLAVLAAVSVADRAAALDGAGWVHVARRVAALLDSPVPGSATAGATSRSGTGARFDRVDNGRADRLAPLVRRARRALPRPAWDVVGAGGPGVTDADRAALAELALLLVEPAAARDAALVAAVAAPEAPPAAAPAVTDQPEPEPIPPEAPTATEETEPLTTAWGGVLYLVHAVTALDLPADDPDVLAWALAEATGAPDDDPVVAVTAGLREPRPRRLAESEAEQASAHADALRAWTLARLEEEDDADLTWVWRRPAVLDVRRGWTEAEFRLADVDVRIRRAGLDLDPGFVWWLGSVVRFRHA